MIRAGLALPDFVYYLGVLQLAVQNTSQGARVGYPDSVFDGFGAYRGADT